MIKNIETIKQLDELKDAVNELKLLIDRFSDSLEEKKSRRENDE